MLVIVFMTISLSVFGQNKYENKPIAAVDVTFDSSELNPPTSEQYRIIIRDVLGPTYSTTKIHDSIVALYNTKKIATVIVTATLRSDSAVDLRYNIKRKTQVDKVSIIVAKNEDDKITEQDLLFKLNILTPGTAITEQSLRSNADLILDYLRERGFYRSTVTYKQKPTAVENEVGVIFNVEPNEQATVDIFKINIEGLPASLDMEKLSLQAGGVFSRDRLTKDIEKIRSLLREKDFVAPTLDEPRVVYDSEKNAITIELNGKVGPTVKITLDTEKAKIGDSALTKLLPIKREGSLDFSAIVEGERRLENYYQELGYFFANVTSVCSVEPSITDGDSEPIPNNTEFLCSMLGSSDLIGKTVEVTYQVTLNRKLRLVSLRIRGTDKITIDDVRTVLESQEKNLLGIIPLFGYGRGYTSLNILEEDAATIRSIMGELGYRDAKVRINRGVSPNGEDLIITFEVEEGVPTVVGDVSIVGNTAVDTKTLTDLLPPLTGEKYSRAKFRNAVQKLSEYYSNQGYYDARVSYSFEESKDDPTATEERIKLEFKVTNEGKKVVIGRVLTTGYEDTKPAAILKAATLKPGEFLTARDVYATEQNLYGTDAFDRVEIKPQPAGMTPAGDRLTDIVISVNEQAPRLITYGGGFSTDLGVNGFFDIRHVNLMGNLWQGGARVRFSQRQQLAQIDFINPRFIRDGRSRYAPLTISVQYQRDSTVTRFFRSVFDKGTLGVVQRIDPDGNPIDEFGNDAGSPTINRLTLSAETSRTLSRRSRSILFAKFKFEDVRIFNIESLLIKELIKPDSRIRTSGLSLTLVRDTRENCSVKYSLLELIAKGEPGSPCKYSASDPTRGSYLIAEYSVSVPQLGANIGFQKFQATYNFYYTLKQLRNTTFAARGILGLATVFSNGDRFPISQFPGLEGILPISERFFAGGSTTLRGFNFEEAGPRVVVVPQGSFLNSKREPVFLDPFSIPFGGNALAVVNLEARIPLNGSVRAVPFYDGGNVFRRVKDIFNPPDVPANDRFRQNLRALWSHTVGLGIRVKSPVGGEFGVDYGYLLNPPRFLIPQTAGPDAIYRLRKSQIHFRFSQAF